ncbi:MAG: hypothetical protein QOF10_5493, partial [Kribbellaceae bacterium]|nr:hypothetical protein [Kribbellaceae bacterium]
LGNAYLIAALFAVVVLAVSRQRVSAHAEIVPEPA